VDGGFLYSSVDKTDRTNCQKSLFFKSNFRFH
jgi:hypothetical protein